MFGKYKDKEKYLEVSIGIVDDLTKMIVEILSISSFQELTDKKEELKIQDEVKDILKTYEVLVREKNITVNNSLKNETIYISKLAFEKVMVNLISNSIKYTDKNGIINIWCKEGYFYIENSCKKLNKEQIEKSLSFSIQKEILKIVMDFGLYIIRNILTNYNIDYSFEKSKIGMVFKFRMPVKESK